MKQTNLDNSKPKFQRVDIKERIILIAFFVVVLLRLVSNYSNISLFKTQSNETFYEGMLDWIMLLTFGFSALSIKFRSLSFALLWIVLSIIYFMVVKELIALFPLVEIITFYLFRYIFFRIYKREFIACYLGRGSSRPYFSYIDNRESTSKDSTFTWILFFLNFIVLIFLIYW